MTRIMRGSLFIALCMCAVSSAFSQAAASKPAKPATTTTAPKGLKVGDTYGGGIVFWIDPNSNPAHPEGLCCAPSDQSGSIKWAATFTSVQYMTLNGFADWKVPNKDQLNMMYSALKKAGLGAFANGIYWSATSRDDDSAWYQDFTTGAQNYEQSKKSAFYLRAIRYF